MKIKTFIDLNVKIQAIKNPLRAGYYVFRYGF